MGKNIAQVLDMTVGEAGAFFSAVPTIHRKLQTLLDVGLSYVRLGQSATTLSGGEAQRVKLALELSTRDTGRTLCILDEPTTGLRRQLYRAVFAAIFKVKNGVGALPISTSSYQSCLASRCRSSVFSTLPVLFLGRLLTLM